MCAEERRLRAALSVVVGIASFADGTELRRKPGDEPVGAFAEPPVEAIVEFAAEIARVLVQDLKDRMIHAAILPENAPAQFVLRVEAMIQADAGARVVVKPSPFVKDVVRVGLSRIAEKLLASQRAWQFLRNVGVDDAQPQVCFSELPCEPEVVCLVSPVAEFLTTMVAPATTAPFASATTPMIALSSCANKAGAAHAAGNNSTRKQKVDLSIELSS